MKTLNYTSIAIKIPGYKIFLETTQLFFLEQLLKKQLDPNVLIKKMKLVDGGILIDIKHQDHQDAIKNGLEIMCAYLEILQREVLKNDKIKLQVRLKAHPTFQPILSKPKSFNLSRD